MITPGTTLQRHLLHDPSRTYAETNCWVDAVVELLHLRGLEPLACLPCAAGIDFEGDQFTFYKPGTESLLRLYGVDVHEMQPYRPLPQVAAEQLARDRTLLVEVDGWWLPDTAATSYRREHVKTTIGLLSFDRVAGTAVYAHNSGVYELGGEDLRGALRGDVPPGDASLLPYVELVRWDAGQPLSGDALREASLDLLRDVLRRRPDDPYAAFAEQLAEDLPRLLGASPEELSAHAFATLRMAGSAAAVSGTYAGWAFGRDADLASEAFERVAQACRALSFRLARRRAFDPAPLLSAAAGDWRTGLDLLDDLAR